MLSRHDETAFPVPIGQTGEDRCGMSLRDWFAGMAMQAMISRSGSNAVALVAYDFADMMMSARKEKKPE